MSQYSKLQNLVASMEEDFDKFYDKGNNAAGTRARKGLQELKNLCQDLRKDIQGRKNAS